MFRAGAPGLGLIGFVFSARAGRHIGVSLWLARGWIVFGVLGIGFVLRERLMATKAQRH